VAGQLFPFLQLDFPFPLGPADGRYLARPSQEGDSVEVMVLRTLDAERKPGRRPRRVEAQEAEPEAAPMSRVTVIGAEAFAGEDAAREWLTAACDDPEEDMERGLRSINRVLHGHRIAAHDPYVREVSLRQAHRVRIGFGSGDELIDGSHTEAFVIPPARKKRRQMLEPQGELAGILGGRRPALPSEDLLLRARLDLTEGRVRQAAIQAACAGDALEAELRGDESLPAEAKAWVKERLPALRELARKARSGEPEDGAAGEVDDVVAGMERIVRRRRLAAGR
jgi:hypothetical protein